MSKVREKIKLTSYDELLKVETTDGLKEIDVDKLELITFDSLTNSYSIIGEKGGQEFKDGTKINER